MASYPEINATFPRARARGPIEAMTHLSRLMGTGQFPRARARGPIEALVRWRRRRCRWDFRERALAAPLKHRASELECRRVVQFPRARARGPIEAPCPSSAALRPAPVPLSRSRGPSEAGYRPHGGG